MVRICGYTASTSRLLSPYWHHIPSTACSVFPGFVGPSSFVFVEVSSLSQVCIGLEEPSTLHTAAWLGDKTASCPSWHVCLVYYDSPRRRCSSGWICYIRSRSQLARLRCQSRWFGRSRRTTPWPRLQCRHGSVALQKLVACQLPEAGEVQTPYAARNTHCLVMHMPPETRNNDDQWICIPTFNYQLPYHTCW